MADSEPGQATRRVSSLLILRSTVRTRELARTYRLTLEAAYPARSADVISALTTPRAPWPGPGIAWASHHGSKVSLMRHPPPGVDLDRRDGRSGDCAGASTPNRF